MSDKIELPDVTQDEYVALMDALEHTENDCPTSVGSIAVRELRIKIINHE